MSPIKAESENVMFPRTEKSSTSEIVPAFMSMPFIVSSVIVEITPIEETWNWSLAPDVIVPVISIFPVVSRLPVMFVLSWRGNYWISWIKNYISSRASSKRKSL